MGPPPFGDGDTAERPSKIKEVKHPASMGPPPFGDGDRDISGMDGLSSGRRRFNGATAFRRWRSINLEETGCAKCKPSLQWGHRLSAMEIRGAAPDGAFRPRCSSFNGATAFRRWRSAGDQRVMRNALFNNVSFNGATAFRRWRSGRRPRAAAISAKTLPASMGPPPFGDGDQRTSPCIWRLTLSYPCFNGATAFRRWR